jgi:hypothetical protein
MERQDEGFDNGRSSNINNKCVSCPKPSDSRIVNNHPLYHCIDHPKFINIHLETIEHHLKFSKDHQPKYKYSIT